MRCALAPQANACIPFRNSRGYSINSGLAAVITSSSVFSGGETMPDNPQARWNIHHSQMTRSTQNIWAWLKNSFHVVFFFCSTMIINCLLCDSVPLRLVRVFLKESDIVFSQICAQDVYKSIKKDFISCFCSLFIVYSKETRLFRKNFDLPWFFKCSVLCRIFK